VNSEKAHKPAQPVTAGDVLTFAQGREIRVVRIIGIGARRGPASEARTLYEDLTPPREAPEAQGRSGPRPTKKDRRDMTAFKDGGS
jgi:ribosome-associated heat shock protein Hsp15